MTHRTPRPGGLRTLLAVVLLSAVVTGCGLAPGSGDPTPSPTPTSAATPTSEDTAAATAPSPSTPEATAFPAPSPSTPEATAFPAPTTAAPLTATERTTIWVDDSWEVEPLGEDPCHGRYGPAFNSDTASFFSCGPFGGGMFNCHRPHEERTVVCITDHREHRAVRFESDDPDSTSGMPSEDALPIEVELADGTLCFPQIHRRGQYFENRVPGLRCEDETVLLDDLAVAEFGGERFIDPSQPVYTVQRARGQEAPTTEQVRRVTWVALPGDEPYYWD